MGRWFLVGGWGPEIMCGIHAACYVMSEQCGAPGDYVTGANNAAFVRVADAMLAMGVT